MLLENEIRKAKRIEESLNLCFGIARRNVKDPCSMVVPLFFVISCSLEIRLYNKDRLKLLWIFSSPWILL